MANFFERKSESKFECIFCDFRCSKKGDWNRHILSLKHKRLKTANILHRGIENNSENDPDDNNMINIESIAQKTENILHHSTNSSENTKIDINETIKDKTRKSSVTSILHQSIKNEDLKSVVTTKSTTRKTKKNPVTSILHHSIKCEICGKTYKHQSSLCKHRKKCFVTDTITEEPAAHEPEIKDLINRNNELMEKLIEVSGEKTTTNNFNLNVFLNETCKDALNISDFIASLQIHISDLDHLKDFGYCEGLSSIIVNELKEIEISKRPLHYCNSKNDILYIKEKDIWEPDNQNNDKMKNAIQLVANKCVQHIKTWENKNPNYLESGTKDNDDYHALIKSSIGSIEAKTKERDLNRIVRTVTNQIQLDKNKIDSVN